MTIKIVVPISGGKDSQACLKLALQSHPSNEILGLFCDTQFEHPLTYQHIEKISLLYGVKIERVCAGSVPEQILKNKRFPGGGARFCTDQLKIIPSKIFYKELAEKQGGFQVWLGMRAGESKERARRYQDIIDNTLYPPHEIINSFPQYLANLGVMFKLPILEWSSADVFDFLASEENPLYQDGFERVGCFPCLAAGKYHQNKCFNYDDLGKKHQIIVAELAEKIGNRSKCQDDMFSGCAICSI